MPVIVTPYVPSYITVHLGSPDSDAENVTVSFPDYIKNVASSEIYPTWDEAAVTANIYAQISFALNRVYLEFYRSRGYSFNITNSTAFDQAFTPGRNIFENIEVIVDAIFNDYIRRTGFIEPLASSYCNGTTTTCAGLSQWGSQELAQQGYNSVDILKYYYGNNIEIVVNAEIRPLISSYQGQSISLGYRGNQVLLIQTALNRISQNYPSIPKVYPVDGIYGINTQSAVLKFQSIFNLTADGIIGKSTWYKIIYLYTGIKRLSQLDSEGQRLFGENLTYPDPIVEGDEGSKVITLQYFLSVLSEFYYNIPFTPITGIFGEQTKQAVIAVQRASGLPLTGEVGDETWNEIYRNYMGVVNTVLTKYSLNIFAVKAFSGTDLYLSSRGPDVVLLQQYLNAIAGIFDKIPHIPVTGIFDENTEESVKSYQNLVGLDPTGVVNRATWNSIIDSYKDALSAVTSAPVQYPGYELSLGAKDIV